MAAKALKLGTSLVLGLSFWAASGTSLGLPSRAQDSRELERYQKQLGQLFERLDANNDGRLSPGEIRGHTFLENNFERFDKARKGYLLPADLGRGKGPPRFLGERLRKAFAASDRNGDGLLCGSELNSFPRLRQQLAQADSNEDGCLSLQEIWKLRRSLAPKTQRVD